MRTGTDTLLRQWNRTRPAREALVEGLDEAERKKKLLAKVAECFMRQRLDVPDIYANGLPEKMEEPDKDKSQDSASDPKTIEKSLKKLQLDEPVGEPRDD